MEQVKKIIERKLAGIDYSKEESEKIKEWVTDTLIQAGTEDISTLEAIQKNFPVEYGEAIDEMEKNNK